MKNPHPGRVYLVGGGPGNPELLTLRAAHLIASVETIVYDNLVGKGIVELIPAATERIYVGKQSGNHTLPQEEINALLVRLALAGKNVVRLKGGDPFVFGRGGEEIEELLQHGVPFEVVPGVTAASGMAAYAGIPLTHRDHAQSCTFVTGHLKDGSVNLDWPALARPHQTIVIYMGVGALPVICRQLIAHGLAGTTPAAVVQNATLTTQRVVGGTLATLSEKVMDSGILPPALIVVGDVVRLREKLHWFDASQE
ncbi:MAG: uroporphyrinogen-III C-methyltransferase [Rhodocyclaceae bacterium]|nr:MAG: uroporphyrinogen-III C-methyltransferase [Rhodocyclaceae bacterium]